MFIVGARRAADPNTGVVTTATAASVCDVGPPSASPPHDTENIHHIPSAAVAADANLEGSVHNRSQQQIINGTPSEKAVAHLIAPIANANVKMTTKMKGILKGLRYISQIFDAKEQEMEIGFPTDVKHVAHIGWDGPSVHTPSWMNEFRSVPDHSSAPLATQPTTVTQKETKIAPKSASQDLQQLMEMQDRGEAPTIPTQVLPRRRQSSGGSPFDSPDFLRPPAGARRQSLSNGTTGTANVMPSEPIRSSPSRDKSIDQITTPPAPDAPRSTRRQSTAPPAPLSVDSINDPSSVHHHHQQQQQESPPHVLESPSTSSAGAASPAGVPKQPRRRKTKGSRSGSDGGGESTGRSARAAARAAAQRAAAGASIDDQSSSITSDVESYSTASTNSTAAIDQNHDHTTTSRTLSENINGGGDHSMNVAAPASAIANVNNIGRDSQLSKSTSGNYSSSSVVVLTSTKSITGAEPPAVIEKEEAHILPPNYF